ncbi:MAG: DUF3780 domain-containing protein [Opitutaceae bacterium]|jgi:hypothetical protein|nr:DUF3780 domain-containing protein [Opitutaceae bacterium]
MIARPRTRSSSAESGRRVVGLGFIPAEARHGFVITVPRGTGRDDLVAITEHRESGVIEIDERADAAATPTAPNLRVLIDRRRWEDLAPVFWDDANRRLRVNGLPTARWVKNPTAPIPVHPSLGKELCILCWAVEDAPPDDIPNALRNWEALAPEERWWLYTMAVATTGQAMQKGIGWRKALRAALADNPFVKGEGMSPRARRELLGHSQLALSL